MRAIVLASALAFAASAATAQTDHAAHDMGPEIHWMVSADRAEIQFRDGADVFAWETKAWIGGDYDRLWFETDGAALLDGGGVERASATLAYGRAVTPFFDLLAGARYDFAPRGRTHGMLGLRGLAPYWFEVSAKALLSTRGELTAQMEAEYDLLLTQRLVLQPRLTLDLSAQDIGDLRVGAGFTETSAGLRLRYEIQRELAPYIGVEWRRALGETAIRARAAGRDAEGAALLIGVRAWF